MTLQQLRYMICVAERASLGEAAAHLHISQPAISLAIRELELEIGNQLFCRNPRGMTLTLDGLEFLSYARQVIQQVDILERKYQQSDADFYKFSISTQHYTFIVSAFIDFANRYSEYPYIFNYRETTTSGIIEDVANGYSELGIIFCSTYNERIMRNIFKEHQLAYDDLIWQKPHIFIAANHPLATKKSLSINDLEPFPCVTFDRGRGIPMHYAEEILSDRSLRQNIRVTDRDSAVNFILGLSAYHVGTGIFTVATGEKIIARPLEADEYIRVIRITRVNANLSPLAQEFMESLRSVISRLPEPVSPRPFLP